MTKMKMRVAVFAVIVGIFEGAGVVRGKSFLVKAENMEIPILEIASFARLELTRTNKLTLMHVKTVLPVQRVS